MRKVGILTWHSQINYGGVLQCVATQAVLRKMGYDAVVIDRWMYPHKESLDGIFAKGIGIKQRVKLAIQSILWPRMLLRQVRHLRTMKFVRTVLNLSSYHFYEWKDAPQDLGVDTIVVGSDQLWHCGDFGEPDVYLFEGAHCVDKVRKIAYAVSYGIPQYPEGFLELFRKGLKRFDAISVREKAAVDLVEEAGANAVHAVDPTLLVDRKYWQSLLTEKTKKIQSDKVDGLTRRVVCYFIKQDIEEVLPVFEKWGKALDCRFDVITTQLRPHLNTKEKRVNYIKSLFGAYPHVHLLPAVGPHEFLQLYASADACITDSFHSLMFSTIFGLNCRVLRPASVQQRLQFARLDEFASYVEGQLIVDDAACAIASIANDPPIRYKYEQIDARRAKCWDWLKKAIED